MSLKGSILASLRRARESGELTDATPHANEFTVLVILLAGDGYRQGLSTEAVRIGIALLTTTGLNQSPHDWSDFCLYAGEESYNTIVAYLQPLRDEIIMLNVEGRVEDAVTGDVYTVKMLLGGDLPWLLSFIGKRSMNCLVSFSPYCLCSRAMMYDFYLKGAEH
eukprot:4883525-Pleurochrysis_carterae.AAC.1